MIDSKETGLPENNCLNDFLLVCGRADSPHQLAVEIVERLRNLCPYDSATAYLLDRNGNVCGHHLFNVEERWSKLYLAYYMNTDAGRYNFLRSDAQHNSSGKIAFNVCDWENVVSEEFVPDFVRARGIKYTCGFGLFDLYRNLRTVIALDRYMERRFTEKEIKLLYFVIPHLNNLHKNYFYQGSGKGVRENSAENILTVRETQITELLCQSLSPAEISRTLHIARSTTYKHIANIYEKMNVSSQRELLAKLLYQPD